MLFRSITDSIQKGEQDNFFAHGGTVTVKGEGGSIDASMSQISGKTLKIVARWDCGAPAAQAAVSGHGWKLATLVASNKEALRGSSWVIAANARSLAVN